MKDYDPNWIIWFLGLVISCIALFLLFLKIKAYERVDEELEKNKKKIEKLINNEDN